MEEFDFWICSHNNNILFIPASHLCILDLLHFPLDFVIQGLIALWVLAIGLNQLVCFLPDLLYLRTSRVVLVLQERLYQIVTSVQTILYLHQVWLPVLYVRNVLCSITNALQLSRVSIPVVVSDGALEVLSGIVVGFYRIHVFLHVAWNHIQCCTVCI